MESNTNRILLSIFLFACIFFQISHSFQRNINIETNSKASFSYLSKSPCTNKLYANLRNNENEIVLNDSYRVESLKTGVIAALAGSIGNIPIAVTLGYLDHFSPQWEFSHDELAVSLFLFGLVYRYSVRETTNSQLQSGVVGAFAIVRALSKVVVPTTCTSLPLNCGPPFYYLDISMITTGTVNLVESFAAFFIAAYAIEFCFSKNVLGRCTDEM